MSITVTAHRDEPLDALVWRATGGGPTAVERTLEQSPGLSLLALALPDGTQVTIPDIAAAPATADLVQLWD